MTQEEFSALSAKQRRDCFGSSVSDTPCPQCLQTGHVCLKCNLSKYDCRCSVGEYNDTICPACNGRGVIEK